MASLGELEALERAVGAEVRHRTPVGGGNIADTEQVLLSDGRTLFLKTRSDGPAEMFLSEAEGLSFLREACSIRIPRVIAVSGAQGAGFLALELIASNRAAPDFDERLGRGIAELHRFGAPSFGFSSDNFLATLRQENGSCPDWPTFYASRRLEPLVRMARNRGLLSATVCASFDRVTSRIAELARTNEPASRLHGDLWSGNVIVDESGGPCLIDPAVYGGHREIDLGMMRLFGGFSARVFDAYDERWPLEAGHERRVKLYQLYPLLTHVLLFGGGYVAQLERALALCLV